MKRYLAELPFTEFAGSCYNAVETYQYLKAHKVDILLLDINMPEIDGFALLDMLPTPPAVIITTAYSHYAMKSYEYDAIDYLHKPVRLERFIKAIEKASRRLSERNISMLQEPLEIKTDGRLLEINPADICYIQSMGNYVKIVCKLRTHIASVTTKELEQRLQAPQFLRIHKSFIVNTRDILEVKGDKVSTGKGVLPLGKTFKKYLELFYSQPGGNTP